MVNGFPDDLVGFLIALDGGLDGPHPAPCAEVIEQGADPAQDAGGDEAEGEV